MVVCPDVLIDPRSRVRPTKYRFASTSSFSGTNYFRANRAENFARYKSPNGYERIEAWLMRLTLCEKSRASERVEEEFILPCVYSNSKILRQRDIVILCVNCVLFYGNNGKWKYK